MVSARQLSNDGAHDRGGFVFGNGSAIKCITIIIIIIDASYYCNRFPIFVLCKSQSLCSYAALVLH